MRKIKVLVVTPTLECGGAERFVSLLCNEMQCPDTELVLTVINNADPFYKIKPHVKVTDLQVKKVSRSFFALRKVIKAEKPDIVFTVANHLNLFAAILKNFFPGNIIWLARETSVVSINSKFARWPVFYNYLLRTFYRKLDHIICQSEYMQEDLIKHYNINRKKTTVIYNAADPSLTYYNGQVTVNKFITVARLSPEKGISRILLALSKSGINFKYYVIGSGSEQASLKELARQLGIADKVFFEPEKQRPFEGHESSALYLGGSFYEGFPNAMIEANVIGIPVLTFDAPGGISEIIREGENGFIAADEKAFIEKLVNGVFNLLDRRNISDHAIDLYSFERLQHRINTVFLNLYQVRKK